MKKTIHFSFMMVFIVTTIVLTGCKKESMNVEPSQEEQQIDPKILEMSSDPEIQHELIFMKEKMGYNLSKVFVLKGEALGYYGIVDGWEALEIHRTQIQEAMQRYNSEQDFNVEETEISKVDEKIKQDAISYYGKVVTFADFPSDKILDASYEERINKLITKSDVGGSPENALTYLIFDENGVLFTAKRYNKDDEILGKKAYELSQKGQDLDESNMYQFVDKQLHYKTDLKTFYEVTGLKEATAEYADVIGNIWIFDPYVKFFEKTNR